MGARTPREGSFVAPSRRFHSCSFIYGTSFHRLTHLMFQNLRRRVKILINGIHGINQIVDHTNLSQLKSSNISYLDELVEAQCTAMISCLFPEHKLNKSGLFLHGQMVQWDWNNVNRRRIMPSKQGMDIRTPTPKHRMKWIK